MFAAELGVVVVLCSSSSGDGGEREREKAKNINKQHAGEEGQTWRGGCERNEASAAPLASHHDAGRGVCKFIV